MAVSPDQFHNLQKAIHAIRQQASVQVRLAQQQRQILTQFNQTLELESRRAAEFFQRIAKQQQQLLETNDRLIESVRRSAAELPERERQALQRLGKAGWFVDPGMPAIPPEELEWLFDKYPDETDEWICDFYKKELDAIEKRLVDSYPHRGFILQQAFEAHRERRYVLSIPVFLGQADGIFWERTGKRQNLFAAKQREKAYNEFASQILDNYLVTYLYPLSIPLPLWMNQEQRANEDDFFVVLNRHQVLHGESTDYGTEQNSLKAISLLSYLLWIFGMSDGPGGENC